VGTRHAPARREARIVSLVPALRSSSAISDSRHSSSAEPASACIPRGHSPIPKVGGHQGCRSRQLRALRATHVILNIDENREEDARAIAGFVPELIVTHPLAPLDNLALYRLIGGVFGREDQAEARAANSKQRTRRCSRRHATSRRTACST